MEKRCGKCLKVKDIECFEIRRDRPIGRKSHCKECRLAYKRSRYVSRPRKPRASRSEEEKRAAKAAERKNRRARERGAAGVFRAKDIAEIHRRQRYKCVVCGACTKEAKHIDHIIPLAAGGSNWPENLQILCPPCNIRKSDKDPIEFMQEVGFLL